jgi:hypothetical protein
MNFYTIRLKRHPHLFVGKKSPSYAITTDAQLQTRRNYRNEPMDEIIGIDCYFKKEKYAKVWTSVTSLKQLLTYCGSVKGTGLSEYELLCNNQVITFESLYEA